MATKILSIDVGLKNLSFCHFVCGGDIRSEEAIKIIKWDNICVTEQNCKKIQIETLTEDILTSLTETFGGEEFETDIVLIENQPSLKNGMMKTVSVIIYTFFNMMKMQQGNVSQVRFISASNKLKCKLSRELEVAKQAKGSYKDRKKMSVELAKLYIAKHFPERKEWFGKQPKADDLADAFLLGIYHAENSRVLI